MGVRNAEEEKNRPRVRFKQNASSRSRSLCVLFLLLCIIVILLILLLMDDTSAQRIKRTKESTGKHTALLLQNIASIFPCIANISERQNREVKVRKLLQIFPSCASDFSNGIYTRAFIFRMQRFTHVRTGSVSSLPGLLNTSSVSINKWTVYE